MCLGDRWRISVKKKYYAVKVGRSPGIYFTWDECKKQTDKFSGAVYKSFESLEAAEKFITGEEGEEISRLGTEESDNVCENENEAIAYVDGSYNSDTKKFSYGMVILFKGEELKFSELIDDSELALMRNVAGEIKGAEAAMCYAKENGIKKLAIYHDYEGIARWCLGDWKANKAGTIAYKEIYDKIKKDVDIRFVKVKGHSNDKYNDMADSLAKQAVGIS